MLQQILPKLDQGGDLLGIQWPEARTSVQMARSWALNPLAFLCIHSNRTAWLSKSSPPDELQDDHRVHDADEVPTGADERLIEIVGWHAPASRA